MKYSAVIFSELLLSILKKRELFLLKNLNCEMIKSKFFERNNGRYSSTSVTHYKNGKRTEGTILIENHESDLRIIRDSISP